MVSEVTKTTWGSLKKYIFNHQKYSTFFKSLFVADLVSKILKFSNCV